MRMIAVLLSVGLLFAACATKPKPVDVLAAPSGTLPTAMAAMTEGNQLFRANLFADAKAQYERALAAQPTLAEAHYNLARALESLGDPAGAKKHYLEAANLAPGHKVIWDSPPLRRYGETVDRLPSDPSTTSPPVMPSLGGFGGSY